MKPLIKALIPSFVGAFVLGACSSGTKSDPTPAESPRLTTPSGTQVGLEADEAAQARALGEDARLIRQSANEAIASEDTKGARDSVASALDKNLPDGSGGGPDKRSELIDKATEAARKKAKELGKEDDLDKARSMLDDFLKKDP